MAMSFPPQALSTFSAADYTNVYIQNTDASGRLQVNYGRNKKLYAIPRYTTLTPAKNMSGLFTEIDPDNAIRITNGGNDHLWADGDEFPQSDAQNKTTFTTRGFQCQRYAFFERLGELAKDQANLFQIEPTILDGLGRQAITNREKRVATVLADANNYSRYNNTGTAASLSNSAWYTSSLDNAYIQNGLQAAATNIILYTAGSVFYTDLCIVMNPNTARKLATAPEVKQATIQQQSSPELLSGDTKINRNFGLFDYLFGFQVVINSAANVTTRKNSATTTRAFIIPDNVIYMVARPGGIEGTEGSTSFSTVHLFVYEDMKIETIYEQVNKRYIYRCIDNFDVQVVAPACLFGITAIGP